MDLLCARHCGSWLFYLASNPVAITHRAGKIPVPMQVETAPLGLRTGAWCAQGHTVGSDGVGVWTETKAYALLNAGTASLLGSGIALRDAHTRRNIDFHNHYTLLLWQAPSITHICSLTTPWNHSGGGGGRHLPSDVYDWAGGANSPGILCWTRMSVRTFSLRSPAGLAAWQLPVAIFPGIQQGRWETPGHANWIVEMLWSCYPSHRERFHSGKVQPWFLVRPQLGSDAL